ncbi:hypothetical protein EC991_004075 [Linnemannia zychae]|nr:hypothetical protein EC991_004075 [Linnemannia zychae]
MTTVSQQFASLAEFNRNRKGKGIARGFYRSSKEERRRLQQEKQKLQPWRATMDGLPREIKIHIFRYLSTFQLVRVSRVSRSWRSIAMDGSLWKVIDTTRFYKIIKDDQLRVLEDAPNSQENLSERSQNTVPTSNASISQGVVQSPQNQSPTAWVVQLDQELSRFKKVEYCWVWRVGGSVDARDGDEFTEIERDLFEWVCIFDRSGVDWAAVRLGGGGEPKASEMEDEETNGALGEGDGEDEDEEDEEERERRAAEELDEEYEYGEDDSDKESEVDGDDEDDENGNLVKNSSSSNAATTTTSSGRSGEEGLQARLDYLGLSHCRLLTTEALRAIGHYCNRHLRRLELSGCEDLTDEGLILLAQNCTRLRLLDLEEVSLLTDASLRAFGMHLSKLERLSLSYCENVTDQGIIRMLRPAPNPTTLSTANNTIMANPDSASQCCRRLVYLELDNCLLITDRLLLEFANVLEERKAVAIEKMKEKEKKREERRERIRQKKRKSSLLLLRSASSSGSGSGSGSVSVPNLKEQQQQRQSSFEGVDIYLDNSGNISANNNEVDDASTTTTALGNSSGSGSFVASRPVNIPTRLRLSNPSLAASGSGSVISSYTSSPLQPRSVLASTLVSDEIVVKKTRPGLRIMVPTRSASTTSTTSTTSITSSSSLALWPSALQSRRRRLAAQAAAAAAASGKDGKYTRPRPVKRRRLVRPTLQIFDCRNITLEGVEAAQLRCPSLAIKSYYSWSNPSTSVPAASTLGFGGSGGSLEEAFEGELEGDEDEDEDADDEDVHGTGIGHGSGRRSGSSGAGGVGGVLTGGVGGSASSGSANSSQTSLHHLHVQQQHLQQLQLQRLNRPANLLQRARLGLLGGGGRGGGHGHQDSQCTIL